MFIMSSGVFEDPNPTYGGCNCDGAASGGAEGGGLMFPSGFDGIAWKHFKYWNSMSNTQRVQSVIASLLDALILICFLIIFWAAFALGIKAAMKKSTEDASTVIGNTLQVFAAAIVVNLMFDWMTGNKYKNVDGLPVNESLRSTAGPEAVYYPQEGNDNVQSTI